jgi:hypothetical protein
MGSVDGGCGTREARFLMKPCLSFLFQRTGKRHSAAAIFDFKSDDDDSE